ncbi:MAG TPA: hypothetical protein VJ464_06540 [Blastocatellia bacterium]|nr:hypothetical protein [Blastocatellia bacterium]
MKRQFEQFSTAKLWIIIVSHFVLVAASLIWNYQDGYDLLDSFGRMVLIGIVVSAPAIYSIVQAVAVLLERRRDHQVSANPSDRESVHGNRGTSRRGCGS